MMDSTAIDSVSSYTSNVTPVVTVHDVEEVSAIDGDLQQAYVESVC